MSNDPTREEPPAFDAPPPPQAESPDEAEDMGLATEMVFSGQRRQQLRDNRAYETLVAEDATSEDGENFYEDVTANDDATDEHSTELLLTEKHPDLREAVPQTAQGAPRNSASAAQTHQSYGASGPRSFDPKQYYSQQTGSSNQSFALIMLIVLLLAALGIFGVLGLLIYRITMGT